MTLVMPRGQTAQPGPAEAPVGAPQRPSWDSAATTAGRGSAATQYKRSPMATEGHRASE